MAETVNSRAAAVIAQAVLFLRAAERAALRAVFAGRVPVSGVAGVNAIFSIVFIVFTIQLPVL
jgi:low temperature requirement protein LtrA